MTKRSLTSLPVARVSREPRETVDETVWPVTIPAVRQLLDEGLDLGPLTVLVGENGSGKSTLVEALAIQFGMSREGGSTGARHSTRESESDLWKMLSLSRQPGASRWGFFLRAETMHGYYTYLEENPGRDPAFHEMSHGESFVEVLRSRVDSPGLYLLDEPESALSFTACLGLVGLLSDIARSSNVQAVVATHSPIVAATPGARIVELGPWGIREASWEELDLVQHWRAFMTDPQLYLRHL